MIHLRKNLLLFAVIVTGIGAMASHAGDQSATPPKDVLCQSAAKTGADCHSPGSRAAVLKTFLAEQEKLAAQAGTNGVKSCDKPPSRTALMQKAAPAAK